MSKYRKWSALGLTAAMLLTACSSPAGSGATNGSASGVSGDVAAIAKTRGLSAKDIENAVKTFVPGGKRDEAVMFASGGHSGQVIAIGIPSMRVLRQIPVFSYDSWTGWGYSSDSKKILAEGNPFNGKELTWGDAHHPNLSETGGDYDGKWLFINDKNNGRIAVIDLRDYKTKQIVKNPLMVGDHGGSFVTPNTEYIVEGGQYATPEENQYVPLNEYAEKYKGYITFWKFNKEEGRIDKSQSFAMELPPYSQDLCDAGKGPSEGLVFCNSFNTEMFTGWEKDGDPHMEAGASKNAFDYLHVIDWKKAEAAFKAGRASKTINGMKVIPMEESKKDDMLVFVPEPKSPHGSDVTPNGENLVIGGKLIPTETVYDLPKIKEAIAAKKYEKKDPFGFNVIKFEDAMAAQVEVGLGPLHTVFDDKGYAYTSLFIDSAVARWSLGNVRKEDGWKMIQKLPINYSIGHIAAYEGDTMHPKGKYVVALNKWSLDRFQPVGPLLPQDLQLIDAAQPGATGMSVIYDMPLGFGEPHYAQIIEASKLVKTFDTYPEIGWDAEAMKPSATGTTAGKERVERTGEHEVHVYMTAVRSHFTPEHVEVKQGDHVYWHITNIDKVKDAVHGFGLSNYNIALSLEPGETVNFDFVADKAGIYSWYCTEFCSALHIEMTGYLQVKPQ